jgi:hypothetical protein
MELASSLHLASMGSDVHLTNGEVFGLVCFYLLAMEGRSMSIVLFLFLRFKYHIQLALYCTTEAYVLCTCWPYKKSCSVILTCCSVSDQKEVSLYIACTGP